MKNWHKCGFVPSTCALDPKSLITFFFKLFLAGSNHWYHGPVQRIWVVSFHSFSQSLCWCVCVYVSVLLQSNGWKQKYTECVSAATWTTVRRLRSRRTTSIRGRRTSDLSALSCCGSWGKVVTERYLLYPRGITPWESTHNVYTHSYKCTLWTIFPLECGLLDNSAITILQAFPLTCRSSPLVVQVFQVRKVVGAASGKIFAMKVLKKVHFSAYFSLYPVNIIACLFLFFSRINTTLLLSANIGCPWSWRWGKISLPSGRVPSSVRCCCCCSRAT